MNKFTYQVYYEHTGPTLKSSAEIESALSNFPNDLPHFFAANTDVKISHDEKRRTENSIFVVIETTVAKQQITDAVERCLNAFGLFGKVLK